MNSGMLRQLNRAPAPTTIRSPLLSNLGGAEKFGAWTGANINEYMGVVLNDEVKSIAYIKSQIYDQGEISGRFH